MHSLFCYSNYSSYRNYRNYSNYRNYRSYSYYRSYLHKKSGRNSSELQPHIIILSFSNMITQEVRLPRSGKQKRKYRTLCTDRG